MKVGFIGAGGIAKAHLKILQKIKNRDIEIAAISDINQEKAENLTKEFGGKAFKKYQNSLSLVDAVYVCTPPSLHCEEVVTTARAGKDIFCEKPMALATKDAELMIKAAKENNIKLMIGFNHRFRPATKKLREIYQSKELGDFISYNCNRLGWGLPSGPNWRINPDLLCGMTIESLSHDFDLMMWILDEHIDRVYGEIKNSKSELEGFDDNMAAVVHFKSGGMASFQASWSASVGFGSRGIIGTEGSALIEGPDLWTLKQVRWKKNMMSEENIVTYSDEIAEDFGYAEENNHFLNCITNNKIPSVTGKDGLTALKISKAILKANATGEVVNF